MLMWQQEFDLVLLEVGNSIGLCRFAVRADNGKADRFGKLTSVRSAEPQVLAAGIEF